MSLQPTLSQEDLSPTNCQVLRVAHIPAPNVRSEHPHSVCEAWMRIESPMTTYTSVITYSSQVANSAPSRSNGPNGHNHQGRPALHQVGNEAAMQSHNKLRSYLTYRPAGAHGHPRQRLHAKLAHSCPGTGYIIQSL